MTSALIVAAVVGCSAPSAEEDVNVTEHSVTSCSSANASCTWHVEVVDRSGKLGGAMSLVLDPIDGTAHLTYVRSGSNSTAGDLVYAHRCRRLPEHLDLRARRPKNP
jgi:hypothetical protein